MSAGYLLVLTLVIPLLGAVLIALCGRWPNLRETVSLGTAVLLFATVVKIALGPDGIALDSVVLVGPAVAPGLTLALHVEPLSVLFALVASGLWVVTTVYAIGYMRGNGEHHQTRFYLCFAVALSGAMGVAFAANLFTLFIAYEVLTLSTYPLVAHKGDAKARDGARTYLGVLLFSSIGFLMPAIVWVWLVAGTTDFAAGGVLAGHLDGVAATALLLLFVLGIGKAAVMPMHRWLPAAMVAPTPVSALLHAVAVVKAGVFTLIKVVIYTFGLDFLAAVPWQEWAMYLAGFTLVAASVVALRQTNLKRMLAYSTISQLSYVAMAALVLAPLAEVGAVLHIAVHAVGKITLFFAAGAIYVASGKTELAQLDGIGRYMPVTMAAFTIAALSMIGVPPTAGFVSKWYMLAGAFEAGSYFMLGVLVLSTVLNAGYFLPVVYRAFFRAPARAAHWASGEMQSHGEAPWPMVLALGVTAMLTLLLFAFNAPVVNLAKAMLGVLP
ncbi:MAG: proton-conducting transporter membrane subunit [Spongiibacteraceae bacterium]|nr:proton-conducting transporter membrane subunit [Spongiibacteraceae bacterium]